MELPGWLRFYDRGCFLCLQEVVKRPKNLPPDAEPEHPIPKTSLSPYTVETSGMGQSAPAALPQSTLLSFVASEKFARLAPGLAEAWRSLRSRDEAALILLRF